MKLAEKAKMRIIGDRVVVTILTGRNYTSKDIDERNLIALGSRIQAKAKNSMRVEIPIEALENAANAIKGFGEIRLPIKPEEHLIISEGVTLMNAEKWQFAGYEGAGVKIAVIDAGFMGLTEAQDSGEIPLSYVSQDFSGNGLETDTPHGTAVTEAIFDLAPKAEFYLYKISDLTDFENAKDSSISNGIDIINHSMGWFNTGGYYDGTGYVCDIVGDAIANGILWINSAGNSAKHHYRKTFQDNGSNYHDFSGAGDTINPIGPNPDSLWCHSTGDLIKIALNWNDYASKTQDYDLYLARYDNSQWEIVDSSVNRQNGQSGFSPEEYIVFENTIDSGMYGIMVKKFSATIDVDFTLFSSEKSLGYHTEPSSLQDPGTVTDVVTVGAINRNDYSSGPQEPFSSQGPTTDGRTKPDITAPDNCNSYTYGYWYGTSLSSPHIAGICALIKSRFPEYNDNDIRNYLYTNSTVDLGTPGKDNIYGWGKVVLPDDIGYITDPQLPEAYSMITKAVTASGNLLIKYELPEKVSVIMSIYDIKGTEIMKISKEQPGGFYSLKIDMSDKPAGIYFLRMEAKRKKFTESKKIILIK